jgi:hypothetical protein
MKVAEGNLLEPVERLETALHAPVLAREQQWAQEVAAALTDLEQALRQHLADAELPQGAFAEVDHTRRGLVRQAGALWCELNELLTKAAELKGPADCRAWLREHCAVSLATLAERADDLLRGVHRLMDGEVDVVMESINMDLGAGD